MFQVYKFNHTLTLTPFDIAQYLGNSVIADDIKYCLIENRTPVLTFKYPSKQYNSKKQKGGSYTRYFNQEWLKEFPFLTYSKHDEGIYCLSCTLFPVKGQCHRAKLLITQPYQNWKDAHADFQKHSTVEYHKNSDSMLHAFLQVIGKGNKVELIFA